MRGHHMIMVRVVAAVMAAAVAVGAVMMMRQLAALVDRTAGLQTHLAHVEMRLELAEKTLHGLRANQQNLEHRQDDQQLAIEHLEKDVAALQAELQQVRTRLPGSGPQLG